MAMIPTTETHPREAMRGASPNRLLRRYQINRATLHKAGWTDEGGNWTPSAHRAGVRMDEQFLTNPAAQGGFCGCLARLRIAVAASGILQRGGTTINTTVAGALYALRQTDHWLADAIKRNLDGDTLGRETAEGRMLNFDPTRNLSFIVADMNRDGRTDVFFLAKRTYVRGNGPSIGALMQKVGEESTRRLRIAFEFDDYGRPGAIVLLDLRIHASRHFRLGSGTYGLQREQEGDGAIDFVPLIETPLR